MKLLIADDELIIRTGLSSLNWKSIGIEEVFLACDGLEAKRILQETQIDVVISDIRMPELDGIELSEYIKEKELDMAVIFLSGLSEFDYALAAIRNGVCEYLLKPIKPAELLETVAAACEKLERKRYEKQVLFQYSRQSEGKSLLEIVEELFPYTRAEVRDILQRICGEFNTDISLNSLAEQLHFSTAYVSKIIKKETGYSFSTLLNAIRLYNSIDLLKNGRYKIQEISEKSGFLNQQYYSGVFKKTFGFTPNSYKKQERQEYGLKDVLELLEKQTKEKTEY